jgi:hypothetical protein
LRLAVWVTPGAARSELGDVADGRLRVRLCAPPHEGKANAALFELLAGVLGVPKRALSLVSGGGSRRKVLRIEGIALDDARRRLRL